MPKVKCPACGAAIPGTVDYEAPVTCELCGESFTAPKRPVAKAAPTGPPVVEAHPLPQPLPQPVPEKGPTVDFDFEAKPLPHERASERRPRGAGRAEDGPPRPRPRPGRKRYGRRTWWLTCGGLFGLLFLGVCGFCGVVSYNEYTRPGLAPYREPPNPYQPGTQVRVRESRAVPAPDLARAAPAQLAWSPQHDLLFVRAASGVWVYDLKRPNPPGVLQPVAQPSDMSLAPDQSVLFVGEAAAARVTRFDLASRTWSTAAAPVRAAKLRALDATRLVAMERVTWPQLRLWRLSGSSVVEPSATTVGSESEAAFDPHTGTVIHASRHELTVFRTDGRRLWPTGEVHQTPGGREGRADFSPDGRYLYYADRQYDASALGAPPLQFPEPIVTCSRDVAFGMKGYYRASDASLLGEYTPAPGGRKEVRSMTVPPAVSPDGLSVWLYDAEALRLVEYAIEGDR